MTLTEYLSGFDAASTAAELDLAIRANFKHSFSGPTWARICKARIAASYRICANHPHGRYIPIFGARRQLTVCGETYRIGRGQNGAGVRYVWHSAGEWAKDVLIRNGLGMRAASQIWAQCEAYPHRALSTLDAFFRGDLADPRFDVLYRHKQEAWSRPINYTSEQNEVDTHEKRSSRSCDCGGTLFDWGADFSNGYDFVNWHCNKCPTVFTEYLRPGQLRSIRQQPRHLCEPVELIAA